MKLRGFHGAAARAATSGSSATARSCGRPASATRESALGRAHGYHRALCILSTRYRGTQRQPGPGDGPVPRRLVLGHGLPHRRAHACAARSAACGTARCRAACTQPRLIPVRLRGGRTVRALAFIADPVAPGLRARARPARPRAPGGAGHRPARPLRRLHPATRSSTCTRSACAIRTSSASCTPRSLCAKMAADDCRRSGLRGCTTCGATARSPSGSRSFYGELLGDRVEPLGADASWLVAGRGRRLVVGKGDAGVGALLRAADAGRRAPGGAFAKRLPNAEAFASPLLGEGAFAVTRPGWAAAWSSGCPGRIGRRRAARPAAALRLRHRAPARDARASTAGSGMVESDRVLEGEALAAASCAPTPSTTASPRSARRESRPDHHCYETNGWLDIRDWADRMGKPAHPAVVGAGAPRAGQQPVLHDRGSRRPQGGVLRRARADAARDAAPHLAPRAAHAQPLGLGLDAVLIRLRASSARTRLSPEVQPHEARIAELRARRERDAVLQEQLRRAFVQAGAVDPREVGRLDVGHRQADAFLDQVAVAAQVVELRREPVVAVARSAASAAT